MKTKEELTAIKKEYTELNKKLAELTEEELAQVAGGLCSEPRLPDPRHGSLSSDPSLDSLSPDPSHGSLSSDPSCDSLCFDPGCEVAPKTTASRKRDMLSE